MVTCCFRAGSLETQSEICQLEVYWGALQECGESRGAEGKVNYDAVTSEASACPKETLELGWLCRDVPN